MSGKLRRLRRTRPILSVAVFPTVAVACLIIATSVSAQPMQSTPETAYASAAAFADCIVKKRTEQARTVVLDNVYDVAKRYPKVIDRKCLPEKDDNQWISKLYFPGDTLHQLLANALVRLEFAKAGPQDFSSIPDNTGIPAPAKDATQLARMNSKERALAEARDASNKTWLMLTQIGECVSRRDPEGVRAMAFTPIASIAEKAAIKRLEPGIAACVPAGLTVKMRPSDFRGPAIRSYYHLAHSLDEDATTQTGAQN